MRALVDSGSSSTLIKNSLAISLANRNKLKIISCSNQLKSVSGSHLDVLGKISLNFNINGENIIHYAIVVGNNVSFPGGMLLGRDLLKRMDASINFGNFYYNNFVSLLGEKYYFHKTASSPSVSAVEETEYYQKNITLVRSKSNVVIPKNSGLHFAAKVPQAFNNKELILEGANNNHVKKLMFPRLLVVPKNGQVPVTIFNVSDYDVKINANVVVALAYTVNKDTLPESTSEQYNSHSIDSAYHEEGRIENEMCEPVKRKLVYDEVLAVTKSNDDSAAFNELISSLDLDHLTASEKFEITNLLHNHKKAISINKEIGRVNICPHKIDTQNNAPVNTPQWRIPNRAKQLIEEHVQEMLKEGIVEPCRSPWNSPVLLVKKKDDSFRFCVDYRKLNQCIRRDIYPIPRITEVLENLQGASVFTTLDMKSGFHQIELDEDSRDCTAFRTNSGSYRYTRCPQGLASSTAAFQRAFNLAFSKQLGRFAYAYVDDLVIFSNNFEEHLKHLEDVFSQIESTGFKLGLGKSQFAKKSIKYLGHVVDSNGVQADPEKTEAISNMSPPRNAKGVRRFLGCCSYYRRFIKNFAGIAAPLTELTKKSKRFKWTNECQQAFDTLKDRLTSAPVLAYPNYEHRFKLHCDASGKAIGGVLNQEEDGVERPIAYFSRKLKDTECKFSITELEALAVYESVKFFCPYLWGYAFDIYTDHSALRYIFQYKNSVPRIARWSLFLADFNYTIYYKDGKSHVVPDFLSRMDDNQEGCVGVIEEEQILDKDNLILEQGNDKFCSNIVAALSGEKIVLPKSVGLEEFFVEEGVLFRQPKVNTRRDSSTKHQIVVPKTLINKALEISHDSPIASHPGVLRTLERARNYFYWIHQAKDVKYYVKNCLHCQKRSTHGRLIAPLGEFKAVSRPLERVGIDLVELGTSYSGNKYFVTIIDHFTRYVTAIPIPDKTADTVTQALLKFVSDNSMPQTIISDRGSEFVNELFKTVCNNLKAKCKLTTAYHPMANGCTERANGTIKQALSHLAAEDMLNWDKMLPLATLAVNTAYHSQISEIPFFLFHGRDARLPFNELINKSPRINYAEDNFAHETACRLAKAFAKVKTMNQKSHDIAAKYYNRRATTNKVSEKIEIGSLVLLRNETMKPETQLAWPTRFIGPYRVIDRFNNNFVIEGVYANKTAQTVHMNRLKVAHLRSDTAYPFNNAVENDEPQSNDDMRDDSERSSSNNNVGIAHSSNSCRDNIISHANPTSQASCQSHASASQANNNRYNLRPRN